MGGSGGNYNHTNYGSAAIHNKLLNSNANAQKSEIEIEIEKFLEELLKGFNDRDVNAINVHLEEIERTLAGAFDGIDRMLLGGSLSKSTFIDGLSDVDALVFINDDLAKKTPSEVQQYFFTALRQRFPNTKISKGDLAITVSFSDYEVQLLPAIKTGEQIRIASNNGMKWSTPINTKQFTSKLTAINKMNGNKVIPSIKIAKAVLANLPDKYRLSGYHIETIAVEAFADYNGRQTTFEMTKYLLSYTEKRVLAPIRDITGQSYTIDDNLGGSNSITRQMVARNIVNLNAKFANAGSSSVTKNLFAEKDS